MAAATSMTPHLSSVISLGDLTLGNRCIMASLTRNRAVPTDVPVHDSIREYYMQRAHGGAGLILSEGALIEPQGTEWPHAPGIWSDEHVQAWRKITDGVHEAGSYIYCQLWHVGRVAHPTNTPGQTEGAENVFGPSAIAAQGGKFRHLPGEPGYVTPTTISDPWTYVEKFKQAAVMAKEAGFDGVELHSATGYLPHQFLDYSSNERDDEWGGSVENRCKFGLECIKAMCEVWGPARVGIKVSPCGGYNDVGMPLPDTIQTYTYYLTQLASMKLAYVQFVRDFPAMDIPVTIHPHDTKGSRETRRPFKRGTPHDVLAVYAGLFKPLPSALEVHSETAIRGRAMPKPESDHQNPTPTRVFVNGGVTPEEAEDLIKRGVVDAVAFGTPWICNPDFQKRIVRGLPPNIELDVTTLYNGAGGDIRAGYTTYPVAAAVDEIKV